LIHKSVIVADNFVASVAVGNRRFVKIR